MEKDKRLRPDPPASGRRRKVWRWAILLALLALVAGAVFGVRGLYSLWFPDNERLVLRRIEIRSQGYWSGRESGLMRRLGLREGAPLFELDMRELREKLERIPCVESARVYRVLPDTLRCEITERIPRAFLGKPGSELVADENSVVMTRRESLASDGKLDLPIITGVNLAGVSPGQPCRKLRPALDLIMLTLRRYPMFDIRAVSMTADDSMACYFFYHRGRTHYRAVFPAHSRNYELLLSALESAIIDVRRNGDQKRNFNLSWDGQVVTK